MSSPQHVQKEPRNVQKDSKGFFAALFDLKFQSFVTLRFLSVIYVLVLVAIGLAALFWFIALATQGAGPALLGLVVVPIITVIYVIFARMSLEVIAVLFRISENTTRMVAAGGGAAGGFGETPEPDRQAPPSP